MSCFIRITLTALLLLVTFTAQAGVFRDLYPSDQDRYEGEPHKGYDKISTRDHLPASAIIAANPAAFTEAAWKAFTTFRSQREVEAFRQLTRPETGPSGPATWVYEVPVITGTSKKVLIENALIRVSVHNQGYYSDRSALIIDANFNDGRSLKCGTLYIYADGFNGKKLFSSRKKFKSRNADDFICVERAGTELRLAATVKPLAGLTEDNLYYHANRDPAGQEAVTAACKATNLNDAEQTRRTKAGSYDGPEIIHHAVYIGNQRVELTSFGRALQTRTEEGETAEVRYAQTVYRCSPPKTP